MNWFSKTPSRQVASSVRKYALYGAIALVIFFVVTGRLNWLYGLLVGLIPVAQRLFTLWNTANSFRRFGAGFGPGNQNSHHKSAGQTSTIDTPYLSMSLNHDTGEMTGIVLQGQYKGHRLDELSLDQLVELLKECRINDDTDSEAVLESYLDRYHNTDDWREKYQQTNRGQSNTTANKNSMTADEAYQILGVQKGANIKEIKAAHRRLMQKFHPDRGGSNYLSVKINQAKDYLLNTLEK